MTRLSRLSRREDITYDHSCVHITPSRTKSKAALGVSTWLDRGFRSKTHPISIGAMYIPGFLEIPAFAIASYTSSWDIPVAMSLKSKRQEQCPASVADRCTDATLKRWSVCRSTPDKLVLLGCSRCSRGAERILVILRAFHTFHHSCSRLNDEHAPYTPPGNVTWSRLNGHTCQGGQLTFMRKARQTQLTGSHSCPNRTRLTPPPWNRWRPGVWLTLRGPCASPFVASG